MLRAGACCLMLFCSVIPAAAQFGGGGPQVTYQTFVETDGVHAGKSARLAVTFKLSDDWHVNSNAPLEPFLIPTELTLADDPRYAVEKVVYPKEKLLKLAASPNPLAVYEAEFTVGVQVRLADSVSEGAQKIEGTLRYQACNDKVCAPPKNLAIELPISVVSSGTALTPQHAALFGSLRWTDEEKKEEGKDAEKEPGAAAGATGGTPGWKELADRFVVANRAGYSSTAEFVGFIDDAEKGTGSASQNKLAGMQWWWVVLAVIGGGFLLNLTPCVLPLIPINIGIIGAGARAGSKGRGFALGGAYGIGISLVYGALGLAVVLGLSTTFGNINSTVWFNAGIAVLFVFLGLAMFDLVHIDFSKYQAKIGIRRNEKGSFLIAFGMGAISALLAGACVAPVVIYTVVYAQDLYSQGIGIALALPFLLGVGMALPWPFAGAGMSFLPKPGRWMPLVKQGFGVFIIAFAAYYGWEAYKLTAGHVSAAEEGDWITSLEEGLAKAQAEQKPVLLDFWATWCKNCLVMDATTLKDPVVLERLSGYVKIKYQAEDPTASPAKEVVEHYEVIGFPAYLILQPKA